MSMTPRRHTTLRANLIPLSLAGYLAGCFGPVQDKEIQRSAAPVTIQAEYMAYACGDFFPQIKPIDPLPDHLDSSLLEGGLTFRLPADFAGPDQIDELGVAGNLFELEGYYHRYVKDGRHHIHPRFDLYAWRPMLPYRVWRLDHDVDGSPQQDVVTAYAGRTDGWHRFEGQPRDPEAYEFARRYEPCS